MDLNNISVKTIIGTLLRTLPKFMMPGMDKKKAALELATEENIALVLALLKAGAQELAKAKGRQVGIMLEPIDGVLHVALYEPVDGKMNIFETYTESDLSALVESFKTRQQ